MGTTPSPGVDDRAADQPYPLIRRPITVGGLHLPNRIVMSPMTTYGLADPDGASNDRHRAYYDRRAASGIGLVIVESAMVHPSGQCWPNHLAVHDDRFVPGLAQLASTIKRHGPAAVLQLHHGGRVAVAELSGRPVLRPRRSPPRGDRSPPRCPTPTSTRCWRPLRRAHDAPARPASTASSCTWARPTCC
ncbi:hypothetical protein E4P39_18015 [Blastococcus sp. CT_GayMR19]|nr:hypothetical protein E4P39_18015 [Blastococcus sp. CT_GayMR19]